MTQEPLGKEFGFRVTARWLLLFCVMSAAAVSGLTWTITHPDNHPVVLALSLSWVIVVVVAGVTRDAFLRMDPNRFRLARWEREGRVYGRVGVAAFRWLLQHTPLGWLAPTLKLTSCRSGIELLLREMNYAEGAHYVGGVATLAFAIGYTAAGYAGVGLSFALLTIPVHVYPVMLQRWNRGRVLQVIRRLDTSAGSARRDCRDPAAGRVTEASGIAVPHAATNGGPATRFGNSGTAEGPPSVN
jgi:hypothetical protein